MTVQSRSVPNEVTESHQVSGSGDGAPQSESNAPDVSFLEASHPLLRGLQATFHDQLTRRKTKLAEVIREFKAEISTASKDREDAGVQLYGKQQQLAKLHEQVESLNDAISEATQSRIGAEKNVEEQSKKVGKKKDELKSCTRSLETTQDDLNRITLAIRQGQEHSQEMRTEIEVTRRTTYKSEHAIQKDEKSKLHQDFLVDSMNTQILRLTEKKRLYEEQFNAQHKETETAKAALREAEEEMKTVENEKHILLQQWKTCLLGIGKRNDALQSTNKAILEARDKEASIDFEMRGVRSETRGAQEQNEQFTATLNRKNEEVRGIQAQLTALRDSKTRLAERYVTMKKSQVQTQAETTRTQQAINSIEQQLHTIDSNIQKITMESTQLNEKIVATMMGQTTFDRSTSNTAKLAKGLHKAILDKDGELEIVRNDISRVKVEALDNKAQRDSLAEQLKSLEEALAAKEEMISQYESEIRKRHNHIEKKQLSVDRLNKEYDEKRSKQVTEDTGPLECKVKDLRETLKKMVSESHQMQQEWMIKQAELVELESKIEQAIQTVGSMKHKKTVLDQRMLRLTNELDNQQKEIKTIRDEIRHFRFEMDRLSQLLAEHATAEDKAARKRTELQKDLEGRIDESQQKEEESRVAIQVGVSLQNIPLSLALYRMNYCLIFMYNSTVDIVEIIFCSD
eukprot:GHVT01007272.1.p1 GENE.GHVT01007272.1~~GHVT01007272.1.p1  ORF type:complete len:684 (+),score=93.12 GHVT01007272.1:389-2440(+)